MRLDSHAGTRHEQPFSRCSDYKSRRWDYLAHLVTWFVARRAAIHNLFDEVPKSPGLKPIVIYHGNLGVLGGECV